MEKVKIEKAIQFLGIKLKRFERMKQIFQEPQNEIEQEAHDEASKWVENLSLAVEALRAVAERIEAQTVDPRDDDFGAVLSCAMRYCIDKQICMPFLATGYIKHLLPYITDKTLCVMERDIQWSTGNNARNAKPLDNPILVVLLAAIQDESQRRQDEKQRGQDYETH
jgi:hypothetical protein